MLKKTTVLMFFAISLLLPAVSFANDIESFAFDFESTGVQIYALDDTLPKGYDSLGLVSATGKFFNSLIEDITKETKKLKGNGFIILSMQKDGYHFLILAKVIKTK